MKQSEQNVELKASNQLQAAQSRNSNNSSKGSLQKQEKDLLSQIISKDLHTIPQFSAHYGLTKKQCQSQNDLIKFYTLYRGDQNYLAYFHQKLDEWFRPANIRPGVPKEFFDSINLGVTLLISHSLVVERENPEENFSALIEAYPTLKIETVDKLERIFEHFVQNPSERVFEFISGVGEVQFMIHTDLFPSVEPIIYVKGKRLLATQAPPEIKRRFFHVLYSQKYKSYYDLCLKSKGCQLANNLPFIGEPMFVFREDCDRLIEYQLELLKNKPRIEREITIQELLDQLYIQHLGADELTKFNEQIRRQKQKQVIPEQVQQTSIQILQQRFAQHQEEVIQMEQIILKEQIDHAKAPYCSIYSFEELCQMTQKEIIKRLASYYNISLKQFSNPRYFVGLLFLSFQYVDKRQNKSSFESIYSSLLGFAIQISEFKGIRVVYGSILGYKIVNQVQLPKYFAFILQDMLGQQAIVDEYNPLRVFICPKCMCFDRVDEHDCQNK